VTINSVRRSHMLFRVCRKPSRLPLDPIAVWADDFAGEFHSIQERAP